MRHHHCVLQRTWFASNMDSMEGSSLLCICTQWRRVDEGGLLHTGGGGGGMGWTRNLAALTVEFNTNCQCHLY